ncbi:MAG: nucleotide sugar dehydrogenase [Gammaproteobacteria bacterium]|nr:nucleotide sugar dehydrogenase [Gammaproteobacteria bacterium]
MSHGRRLSVTGLGYVGLPVAVAFGRRGRVIGLDVDSQRIDELRQGWDRNAEVAAADLAAADVRFTDDAADIEAADFHIVAVPTPIDTVKQPDFRPLEVASRSVGAQLKPGDIVVYESTVYPGATKERCIVVLEERSGLKAGRDFSVGYSPERINPGDKIRRFETIPKVVAGLDRATTRIMAAVYGEVVEAGVFAAASIEVAEAAKVIENTQRDLNIALMNELAVIFSHMDIDTRDVLAAAATKWNFLPFEPGLVGGHCIGVDPYYLTHKATALGHHPQVILAGRRINDGMSAFVARRVIKALLHGPRAEGPMRVTVLGLSFKDNVPDLRNSKVADLVAELIDYGVEVEVHDPLVDKAQARALSAVDLVEADDLKPAHAVVVAVGHDVFRAGGWDWVSGLLADGRGVVFDVRGVLDRATVPLGVDLLRL